MLKWRKTSKVFICNHNMLTKLSYKFCGCTFGCSLWLRMLGFKGTREKCGSRKNWECQDGCVAI